jgi:transposase-like protein
MECVHCKSLDLLKNGKARGVQRYQCRSCGRYFSDTPPRFSPALKAQALDMYLNNVGIRKIARFTGASPAGVLRWIRKQHAGVQARLAEAGHRPQSPAPDVIEMDEIYTFVQKNSSGR